MAQLARVHGDDDLGLGGVGEDEARVLLHALARAALGQAEFDQLVVGDARLLHGLEEDGLGLCVGGQRRAGPRSCPRPEVDVALRLLVVAGHAVAHQLVRAGAATPSTAKLNEACSSAE